MNLYYVWQDENNGYDTYDSFVVCAENEEEAKNTHPDGDGNWRRYTWASSPEKVKCELIGTASDNVERGIVIASFNAG